jgi:hypothetical protein
LEAQQAPQVMPVGRRFGIMQLKKAANDGFAREIFTVYFDLQYFLL